MKKHAIILITLTLFASSIWGVTSFAHSAHFTKNTRSAEQSFDFRSATMSIYKWYLSPMGAMMKGKTAFDAEIFAQNASGLEAISNINLLEGFPKGSSEDGVDDSNAKVEIWSHWEDFEKKAKTFQLEAKKLAAIAKEGNEVAIKVQFKKTAKTCATCHKAYKSK